MYVFGTLLTAAGKLRQMNTVFVFGVLANVGLNLWLIPLHGALGAAVASLITQSGITLALIVLCGTVLGIRLQSAWWIRILGFSLVCWWLIERIAFFIPGWMTAFLFAGAAGMVLALISGLLNIRSLRETFSRARG